MWHTFNKIIQNEKQNLIIIRKLIFLQLKGSNACRISVVFILIIRVFNCIPLHLKRYQTIVEIKHAAKTSINNSADKNN